MNLSGVKILRQAEVIREQGNLTSNVKAEYGRFGYPGGIAVRAVTDRYEYQTSNGRTSKRAAVLELFKETAVSCCILYESSEKNHFLLYIRPAL